LSTPFPHAFKKGEVMDKKIRYREGYKYQLAKDYHVLLPFRHFFEGIHSEYISFYSDGSLTIKSGYSWDGCSGPTIDTTSNMRAGLVHDALYQLMREEFLPQTFRKNADKVFKQILKEDGMSWWRIFYYYRGVKRFASFAAKPKNRKEVLIAP